MKVVFLDFDGVLNSRAFFSKRSGGGLSLEYALDPAAVASLNAICGASGALVVITSAWRVGSMLTSLKDLLAVAGFRGKVRGKTPVLACDYRGEEIQAWLDENKTRYAIESYVILDDNGIGCGLEDRLIRTDFASGLLPEHVPQALAILDRPLLQFPKDVGAGANPKTLVESPQVGVVFERVEEVLGDTFLAIIGPCEGPGHGCDRVCIATESNGGHHRTFERRRSAKGGKGCVNASGGPPGIGRDIKGQNAGGTFRLHNRDGQGSEPRTNLASIQMPEQGSDQVQWADCTTGQKGYPDADGYGTLLGVRRPMGNLGIEKGEGFHRRGVFSVEEAEGRDPHGGAGSRRTNPARAPRGALVQALKSAIRSLTSPSRERRTLTVPSKVAITGVTREVTPAANERLGQMPGHHGVVRPLARLETMVGTRSVGAVPPEEYLCRTRRGFERHPERVANGKTDERGGCVIHVPEVHRG
jgi:HAD domain in Swiss Army Knife RNA repair proteins